jgi:hypothetical protein
MLGITLPGAGSASEVDAFIDRSLRHQLDGLPCPQPRSDRLTDIAQAVHGAFRQLASNPHCPIALAVLDRQAAEFEQMGVAEDQPLVA